MEILSRASYLPNSNWLLEESRSTKWTRAENKIFENALAQYDKDTPDRWQKVAALIPGKTVVDVMKQYKELEDDPYSPGGKQFSSTRPSEHERKKGVPWTEEEHKLFLMGLKKYGKGDWRNISRNFVITRTPTQVASHAQKYFIRQLSGGKDKRRASIHDITTVNLNDNQTPSPDNKRHTSPKQSVHSQQPNSASVARSQFQWNRPNNGVGIAFNTTHGNVFSSNPYGTNSNGIKMEGQTLHRGAMHESYLGSQNMVFQMQSAQHYPHG
ncbi:hypothetical protein F0562_001049 [Nyssa sinensis]|uniref:Transcription factor DIVARICATA n=1 Tax=Nyssa sinensis TaxID=561372 RepID=A0A5J5C1V1_9ASTE|nr:hypothetical protein F0562_001049 [Nyssa sinensis]